ncbi:hypothetical protein D5086_027146 [Populus alba]|uniref:Uncharacterized protein n=1 Tax=Populus alba TaxID=43335 RepID=A0ACC4B487_POPAL
MHRSPSIVPPLSSSPSPFGQNIASPVSNKSRHDPSTKTSSLRSRPAVGNLNHGSLVGVVALPTSPGKDKASSGSHRPPSPNHPSGTTIPQSPFLVHFSDYIASSSCQFLETDLAVEKQSIREEPQGELGIDPISVKAAMAVEERVVGFRSKRDKLAFGSLLHLLFMQVVYLSRGGCSLAQAFCVDGFV